MKRLFCILILILIIGCVKQTEESEESPVTEEITEPEQYEIPIETELLSEVRCVDYRVVGVLTNKESYTINIEKDLQLFFNGQINRQLNCAKEILEPEEQTFCETLNGRFNPKTGKNKLMAKLDNSIYDDVVVC